MGIEDITGECKRFCMRIDREITDCRKNKLIGLITIKDVLSVIEHPNAARDSKGRLIVGAAVSTSADTFERLFTLVKAGVDVIVVDTAHSHSKRSWKQ